MPTALWHKYAAACLRFCNLGTCVRPRARRSGENFNFKDKNLKITNIKFKINMKFVQFLDTTQV